MIIARTPFRVSFFGGGTDYPAWFREHGGAVLATSIDKYCYISVRHLPPFFDQRHRVVWSKVENVNTPDEIEHPVVRAVFTDMHVTSGLAVHHDADLPARAGLGSSSSFTVGLINAMEALRGRRLAQMDLAHAAIRVEQELLKENVGCQDQISAAIGGFSRIEFMQNGTYRIDPVILAPNRLEELQDSLLLCFTGLTRIASDVAGKKIANLKKRASELHEMRQMVDQAIDILNQQHDGIADFGRLLHENWLLKRSLSASVSTNAVDEIYDLGMKAGAYGGKLLGAGGGGFVLFVVQPERRDAVSRALENYVQVSFRFENDGSRIIVHETGGFTNVSPQLLMA